MTQPETQVSGDLTATPNPYVGPQPFQKKDRGRFFGRESEARALLSLVLSERLVLFYAQSGAGKSSLINAYLIPALEEHQFAVLPVGRVSGQTGDHTAVKNIYTYNLLLSLDQGGGITSDMQRLAGIELHDYLASLPVEDAAASAGADTAAGTTSEATADSPLEGDIVSAPVSEPGAELQPLVLVIDQFEELFTSYPAAWEQRGAFFQQLAAAMQADPSLWIVLTMREDYVAALDPYTRLLPGRLRVRYSMERMGPDAAFRAVTLPVIDLRPFEDSAANELVNNLRMIVSGRDAENQPNFAPGQFVEPVQLQVVCFQLWEALRESPGKNITIADLERLAQGKELARFVSAALANFYVQALKEVQKEFPQISERRLREWFNKELITENETRGAVRQGKERTGTPPTDLPNAIVRALQDRFIIRSENRGDTTWYELSHDRFVAPILLSNREWQQQNPQPLESTALAWINSGQDPARLLDGRQLRTAQAQLKAHPEEISPVAQRFIDASQDSANKRNSQRQRLALIGLAMLLVVVIGLLIAALRNGQALTRQKATVDAARQLGIYQNQTITVALGQVHVEKDSANAASTSAVKQKQTAESASTLEGVQRQRADAQRQRAEMESHLSLARELATLSETYLPNQYQLALLLGVQALQVSPTWEGRKALLNGLQRGLAREITQDGQPIFGTATVQALAFSPDGSQLAIGSAAGGLRVWDIPSQQFLPVPDAVERFKNVYSIDYNRQGTLLALGDVNGWLCIWNLTTGDVKVKSVSTWVTHLSFNPDGNLLAVANFDNHMIIWDVNADQSFKIWRAPSARAFRGLAWSHDGSRLAIGGSDGFLAIWDVHQQDAPRQLPTVHSNIVRGVVWTLDDRFLISAGRDGILARWDAVTRIKVSSIKPDFVTDLLYLVSSPDGSLLISGNASDKNSLTLWDPEALTSIQNSLGGHNNNVQAVAFSAQGDRMASGDDTGKVVLWNIRTQQPLGRLVTKLPDGDARSLGIDVQGHPFALFGKDQLRAWSAAGALMAPDIVLTTKGYKIALAADAQGPLAAIGDDNDQVLFYRLKDGKPTGQLLNNLGGSVDNIALSTDGTVLAVGAGQQLQIYHLVPGLSPTLLGAIKPNFGSFARLNAGPTAVQANGNLVAFPWNNAHTFTSGVALLDTTTQKLLSITPYQEISEITRLALSPDGELLAIGYADGTIALRDALNQRPIGQFDWQPDGAIAGLAFAQSPGQPLRLYSLTQPGTLMEWDVDLNSWIQRTCTLAGRSLTQDEWKQYLPAGTTYQPACAADSQK